MTQFDPPSQPCALYPVALPPTVALPPPFVDLALLQPGTAGALTPAAARQSQLIFLWSPGISAADEPWSEGSLRWLPVGPSAPLHAAGPLPAHGGGLVCGSTQVCTPASGVALAAGEVPRALAPGIDLRLLAGTGFARESALLRATACALAVCRLARLMRFEFRAEYPQRALYVAAGTVMLDGESVVGGTWRRITGPKTAFIDALAPSVLVLLAG
ncbi:MAG: hypothetical protein EXR83_06715 [Gammaproteobacteria bacterium]|nr:hypothetical protein [Gammaproteobacteria bacterium]